MNLEETRFRGIRDTRLPCQEWNRLCGSIGEADSAGGIGTPAAKPLWPWFSWTKPEPATMDFTKYFPGSGISGRHRAKLGRHGREKERATGQEQYGGRMWLAVSL